MSVADQVLLYFQTIHDIQHAPDAMFQFAPERELSLTYNVKASQCAHSIFDKLYRYKKNSIFCSLNYYKPIKNFSNLRRAGNLWGIDCIMIDIDGTKELCGLENDVVQTLKWAWEHKKIPAPNLISFTGGGGLHLYYAFDYLPASMKKSVQALKWLLAEAIVPYEQDFPSKNGLTFKVDTKVFDTQRLDRVPGSVNPKTGNRCVCFATGQARYSYRALLEQVCPDETYNGKIAIEQCRKNISFFRGERPCKMPYSAPRDKSAFLKPELLAKSRLNRLFVLAKNGKSFENCREMACFFARVWAKQLQYSDEQEKEMLLELNSYFYQPLSIRELFGSTKASKTYSFTNAYLIEALCLTPAEIKIFCPSHRPGDRKEKTKYHKMMIALLTLKGMTIEEVATTLHISVSIVKRRRAEMKKAEGLSFWVKLLKKTYTFFSEFKQKIFSFFQKSSFCKYINTSLHSYIEESRGQGLFADASPLVFS